MNGEEAAVVTLTPIARLTKDLREASKTLGDDEARFLVDAYYTMQEQRKRAANQSRALTESEEPHEVISYYLEQSGALERQVRGALDAYSGSRAVGQWMRSIIGIGPVIAAGLLAHIDIKRANTAGAIWRYAGLDPTSEWKKGQKRPWNASLKTLCWKIGESFVKTCNHEKSFYGPIYIARKEREQSRNDKGELAEQAALQLKTKKFKKGTQTKGHLESGKLSPAHIHARAKRYAVKLFLAHYHEVAWRLEFETDPPKPYVIAHMDHVGKIEVPNWPMK